MSYKPKRAIYRGVGHEIPHGKVVWVCDTWIEGDFPAAQIAFRSCGHGACRQVLETDLEYWPEDDLDVD